MKKRFSTATVLCGAARTRLACHVLYNHDALAAQGVHGALSMFWLERDAPPKWCETKDIASIGWSPVSASTCHEPQYQMIAVGADGDVLLDGKGDFHEERLKPEDAPPPRHGKMFHVRGIGKRAYAVGMGRQVYRRDGVNRWTAIDRGCLSDGAMPADAPNRVAAYQRMLVGFTAIDGFDEDDLYAVGLQGEIWSGKADHWQRRDSPTNLNFNDMVCAGDGEVYAVGNDGLIVRGRGDRWSVIKAPKQHDFLHCCWFNDRLWLSTAKGLFTLNAKRSLDDVDFGDDEPGSFNDLTTCDGILWSVGPKDIFRHDGTAWRRID